MKIRVSFVIRRPDGHDRWREDRGRRRHGRGSRCSRRWQGRRRRQEQQEHEAPEEATDALHVAAAPGAGGHVHPEPVPGHEHPRRDSYVDEPHRGPSQSEY